jgi:alpha-glucosidase
MLVFRNKLFLLIVIILLLPNQSKARDYIQNIFSPTKLLEAKFILKQDGLAFWNLIYKGDTIINYSSLGFVLKDNDSLMRFRLIKNKTFYKNENWKPVWGQSSLIKNEFNENKIELKDFNGRLLTLYMRLYDDGFAFRYEIPNQSGLSDIVIISEESRISFNGKYECWWSWADYNTLEKLFYHTILDSATHVASPFTLKRSNNVYLSIHEAVIDNYSTMTLKREGKNNQNFKINLVPWADGTLVKTKTPMFSPWRAIIITEKPGGLIESNLIENLNDTCQIKDVSWIKPMIYIGIWWEMHLGISQWVPGKNHGATTENTKRYIDFASKHNVKGVLIEGWNTGWENWGKKDAFDFVTPYTDFNLEEVVKYAKSKGVEIIGHHETGGDTEAYEKNIEKAFALYQKLGIKTVKTGYAGPVTPMGEYHHGQCMVQHYNKVMRLAAKYKLMLDVHEPIVLSGLSRTYPNLMTAEGVRGMEWNAWSDGNPPSHTCTLPFTRGIAGPMDYTPGIFDVDLSVHAGDRKKWNYLDNGNTSVHSTIANQLALMLVLYSPLQMAADLPENYEGNKAFSFIENLPTSWDETKVIDASIGEYVIIARRKGTEWYLGAITNESNRELIISFDFLENNKVYKATLFADGNDADYKKNPESILINETKITSNDSVTLKLAKGGGACMKLQLNSGNQ